MASLSYVDKRNLEKILLMDSWYVLDFSDRTFREFVFEYTSLDIHDPKYQKIGTSKAKKLREFLRIESDIIIGNLINGFAEYVDNQTDKNVLHMMTSKLKSSVSSSSSIELVKGKTTAFNLLKSEILNHMKDEKYIESLDRIHTLFHTYLLESCEKFEIQTNKNELIWALLWRIKTYLIDGWKIDKNSFSSKAISRVIQILEGYNNVRNNQSLSHPNQVLNYHDLKFAVDVISSCLSYIDAVLK